MCNRYIIQGVISVEKTTGKPAEITINPSQDYTVKLGKDSFGVLVRHLEKDSAGNTPPPLLYALKEPTKMKISSGLASIALAAACKQAKVEIEVKVKKKLKRGFKVMTIRFPVK